jgi:hypothetical protein
MILISDTIKNVKSIGENYKLKIRKSRSKGIENLEKVKKTSLEGK